MAERLSSTGELLEVLKHKMPVINDAVSRVRGLLTNPENVSLFVTEWGLDGISRTEEEERSYEDLTSDKTFSFAHFRLRYDLLPIEGSDPEVTEQLQTYIKLRRAKKGEIASVGLGLVLRAKGGTLGQFLEVDSTQTSGGFNLALSDQYTAISPQQREYFNRRLQSLPELPVPNFPAEFVGWPETGMQTVTIKPRGAK